MTQQMLSTEDIQQILLDRNDGPVTEFVAISRAIELVKQSNTSAEAIANALYESLKVIGLEDGRLSSTEFVR